MDPYDTIVEQLEGAQEQGLKSIRNRLEAILESLDQVSSSIREELPSDGEEVFPLGDLTSTVAGLREAAQEDVAPPPVLTLGGLRELDSAQSQSDLLRGLLGSLGNHAARAVVLVFRPDDVSAWSAIGFGDAGGLEQWTCAKTDSLLFEDFTENPRPRGFLPADDPVFSRWLGTETEPLEALLVPVSLRGKTMGAVYADRLEGAPWDPDAIQVLVAVSCWMIDTLKYRAASTSPMLAEIAGLERAAAVVEDSVEEAVAEEALDGGAEVDGGIVDEAGAASAALDEMAAEPDFDPSATVQVEAGEPSDEPAAEAEIEPDFGTAEEAEPEFQPEFQVEDEAEPDVSDSTQAEAEMDDEPARSDVVVPMPPPVEPVVPPSEVSEPEVAAGQEVTRLSAEDESRHEEARRFARLLVSEIKLYNEDAVDRGRQQNDLYARLKEDIDRSREMYEKRIPPEIRTARDYFHEELVRILADGDSGALGM